jgi:hypothetical protein
MSVVTNIIVGATAGQGNAQLATNAIAPYASQLIGDTFEHTDDPNKAAQLLSHAVLGAVIAYMNGGDPAAGAASATASELASLALAKELYPEAFDENGNLVRSRLSEEQAESIVAITNAIGALAGGITGGDVYDAGIGSFIGENAVVNNRMLATEEKRFINSQIDDYALANNMSEERAKRILEIAGASLVDGVEIITSLYTIGTTDITTAEILNAQVYLLQSSEGLTYYNNLDDTTRDLFEVAYGAGALLYYDSSDPDVSPMKIIATEVAVTLVAGKILEIGGQVVKKIATDLYEAGGKYYAKLSNGRVVEVEIPPLRQAYMEEVNNLSNLEKTLKLEGKSSEEIAKSLYQARRDLGVKYKDLTPSEQLDEIYNRNLEKYGDKLGPTIEWLRAQGKSWEDIINSAKRTGGKDLGY